MNKRLILISFLMVAVLTLTIVFSACDLLFSNGGGEHEHSFGADWSHDANNHWHGCTVKSCDQVSNKGAHIFGSWVADSFSTSTVNGSRHRECITCHYTETDKLPLVTTDHEHSFEYGLFKQFDEVYHSYTCYCGEISSELLGYHEMSDWTTEKAATDKETGLKRQTCTLCGFEDTAVIPTISSGSRTVELYAINDFHGAWEKMSQVSGFLSARKAAGNALLINSGDMFQGSMESNSNFGALLTSCMDDTHFDSFTYGNHEFDWGLDNLRALASNSQTPFLGANIYYWDRASGFGEFASDFAQEYVIRDLDNGLRVGIIGVIGKDQITSISSQLVQTIGFKDPKEVVPSLSQKLKGELGCDVVIVSAHTSQDTFLEDNSWDITNYADAVFCAHTHQVEQTTQKGVPFIQGGSYGNYVSYISLTVGEDGKVKADTTYNMAFNNSWPNKYTVDEKINNANANIKDEASQVLATLTGGSLNSGTAVPRLVANAIADYAKSQGYEIDLAMVNNARNSLTAGEITYTELYEAVPFDNVVYIAKVSGKDILNEARYDSNSVWRVSGNKIQNDDRVYYYIAVLDYLLYHQNSARSYNYFPSAFKSGFEPVPLTKDGVDAYNYRLITRDYLLSKGTISASIYTSSENDHTNKDLLTETITLALADYATTLAFNAPQCDFCAF